MLLGLSDPGSDWGDDDVVLLLSADGTAYRRLPAVMAEADSTALTDDGRYVVAVSVPGKPGGRPDAVVHLLRLADGRVRDVALPASGQVSQVGRLVVTPDSRTVYVVGVAGTEGEAGDGAAEGGTWTVDIEAGRAVPSRARPLLVTRNGTVYTDPAGSAGVDLPTSVPEGATPLPADFDPRGFGRAVSSPDGRALAAYTKLLGVPVTSMAQSFGFVIGSPGAKPTVVPFPSREDDEHEPGVISWIPAGILFRWNHELRLFDPVTRKASVLVAPEQPAPPNGSRSASFSPRQVAYDVAQAGVRVPGVRHQDEPPWVVRVVRSPSGVRGEAVTAPLGLAAAAGVLLLVRRRRAGRAPGHAHPGS
jgi:hypothetical protein